MLPQNFEDIYHKVVKLVLLLLILSFSSAMSPLVILKNQDCIKDIDRKSFNSQYHKNNLSATINLTWYLQDRRQIVDNIFRADIK